MIDLPVGIKRKSAGIAAGLLQNAGHTALFFPLSEGAGTTIAPLAARTPALTVAGTTAGLWAAPAAGITLTTDNHAWLNQDVAGLDLDMLASIYAMDHPDAANRIIYFGAEINIAAAPASDVTNYLLSMGQRDDVTENTWGQLCVRINQNRRVAIQLHERGANATNTFATTNTALTAGTPASVFGFLLPAASGNSHWFFNGALDNSTNLANLLTAGPLRSDVHGIALFGRSTHNSPFTPQTRLGAGTVAPTVRNLMIGKCTHNANNLALLPQLALFLAKHKRLPHWIGEID